MSISVVRQFILLLFFTRYVMSQSIVANRTRSVSQLYSTALHDSSLSGTESLPTLSASFSSVVDTTNESIMSMSRTPSAISPSRMYQSSSKVLSRSSLSSLAIVSLSENASSRTMDASSRTMDASSWTMDASSRTTMDASSRTMDASSRTTMDASSRTMDGRIVSVLYSTIPMTLSPTESSVNLVTPTSLTVTASILSESHFSSTKIVIANYDTESSSSSLIRETNTPAITTTVTTVATQNDLQYIGVGIGLGIVIAAVVILGSIVLYFCIRSKKREYRTGNTDFKRASVTVQRYNPNKEHYTVNSDSAFSSRGSSLRSSFGTSLPHRGRKTNFNAPDYVTAVINLEMYSTPL